MAVTGPFGPVPPDIDLSENIGPKMVAAVATLMVIATLAMGLRFFVRSVTKVSYGSDDYTMLIGLALTLGCSACALYSVSLGVGQHLWALTPDQLVSIINLLYGYIVVYIFAVPTIKLAILLFYRRIFTIQEFTYMFYGATFLVVGWFIGTLTSAALICRPLSFLWEEYVDETATGVCINKYDFYVGNASASLVTDIIILFIPIPILLRLQISREQKVSLCGIFLLGGFACIGSIVRLYFLTFLKTSEDLPFVLGQVFIWSAVEPSIAILTACLSTYRPLLRRLLPTWFKDSQQSNASTIDKISSGPVNTGISTRSNGQFRQLHEQDMRHFDDDVELKTNTMGTGSFDTKAEEDREPVNGGIMVKTDVYLTPS